jgi:hypothetical protein
MKKTLLLGTTALIAAGFVSVGVAQAEEPITAGISGYFRSAVAAVSQDNSAGKFADAAQSMTQSNDIEITIGGSTTLDNGMTVGFSANIEGNSGTAGGHADASEALDERFVFFNGSFGQIQVGQLESSRQAMTNFAPSGNFNFGVNTPFFIHGNPGGPFFNVRTFSDGLGNEDNIKMVYYSPSFNGFRFGASYAADGGFNGAYKGNGGDALGGTQNNMAVAAEFNHDFGDMSLRLMAGYESYVLQTCNVNAAGTATVASIATTTPASTATLRTAADQNCENNPSSTQMGATVSFGEFSIGGGWLESDQIGNTSTGVGRTREDMDLGIAWWSGVYGLGLQYGKAEVDDAAGLTDSLSIFELNGTYVLGPGIDIGARLARGDFDDATANAADNEYTEFAVGAAVNF